MQLIAALPLAAKVSTSNGDFLDTVVTCSYVYGAIPQSCEYSTHSFFDPQNSSRQTLSSGALVAAPIKDFPQTRRYSFDQGYEVDARLVCRLNGTPECTLR